jgi:hypothetical protein
MQIPLSTQAQSTVQLVCKTPYNPGSVGVTVQNAALTAIQTSQNS